jgi:hypothetical protein
MRHERLIVLWLAATLTVGCAAVDDWAGLKRRKETPPAPLTDDGQIVAGYLATLDRLGRAGAAEQAEILQATRADFLADPSTAHRLRYAFVLAVPGHAASDPMGARTLLGSVLAAPETLLPSERALGQLMIRELDARLALAAENAALRTEGYTTERDRVTDLNQRLQQEIAEKESLRHQLEQAQAKIEAITALEGGKVGRKP